MKERTVNDNISILTNNQSPIVPEPGERAFDLPSALVTPHFAPVMILALFVIAPIGADQFDSATPSASLFPPQYLRKLPQSSDFGRNIVALLAFRRFSKPQRLRSGDHCIATESTEGTEKELVIKALRHEGNHPSVAGRPVGCAACLHTRQLEPPPEPRSA